MIRRRFRRRPFFVVYVARQAAARGVPLLDESEGHEQLNETATGLCSIGLPQTRAMSIFEGGRIRVLGRRMVRQNSGLGTRILREGWDADFVDAARIVARGVDFGRVE